MRRAEKARTTTTSSAAAGLRRLRTRVGARCDPTVGRRGRTERVVVTVEQVADVAGQGVEVFDLLRAQSRVMLGIDSVLVAFVLVLVVTVKLPTATFARRSALVVPCAGEGAPTASARDGDAETFKHAQQGQVEDIFEPFDVVERRDHVGTRRDDRQPAVALEAFRRDLERVRAKEHVPERVEAGRPAQERLPLALAAHRARFRLFRVRVQLLRRGDGSVRSLFVLARVYRRRVNRTGLLEVSKVSGSFQVS